MNARPSETTQIQAGFLRHNLYSDPAGTEWPEEFPFPSVFSLTPVIEHWHRLSEEDPATYAETWEGIRRQLDEVPDLAGPTTDLSLLRANEHVVAALVRPLFPGTEWLGGLARAIADPFGDLFLFRSQRFDEIVGHENLDKLGRTLNATTRWIRTMYGYKAILKRFYDVDLHLDQPLVLVIPDAASGLNRYFKLNAQTHFERINLRGELPELGQADLDHLFRNTDDFEIWSSRLPPEVFEFEGVAIINLTDVTHETATASIKHIVLTSDANITEENFELIEHELRNLYRNASLRLGLASIQADGELNFTSDRRTWNSLILKDAVKSGRLSWRDTVYSRILEAGDTVVVPDVEASDLEGTLRSFLLDSGVRSLFLQPLEYEERMVGLLELTSPEPGALSGLTWLKMLNIKPIFALAVYQNLESFENRVESLIQHTYTAIHPAVAWKFRDAAIAMMEQEKTTGSFEPIPVRFENLHPLYGSADIRGSSEQRNQAIRTDILKHLKHAEEAVAAMGRETRLTILDELHHRIIVRIGKLETGWQVGDQSETRRFIQSEVDPLLESLSRGQSALTPILSSYRGATGIDNSLVSQGRKAFDESQERINGLIVDMLTAEQEMAQRVYPHYSEHTKTDGVEHTIYIGESIAPERAFDLAFVQDLRLRQLIIACKIAREVNALNVTLDVPLEVAQLVLVQHAPISLQFRTDEKKFDVEGVSGIRFEILKKRVDKAHIKGSEERVTQPECIAIVYSLEREEVEYERYLEYLKANAYLDGEPERLEVEDLQGVSGLHALRVRVAVG